MSTPLRQLLLASLLFLVSTPLRAHFVWIERTEQGAAAFFGEWADNVRETEDGYLKIIAAPRAYASDGQELPVTRAQDRLLIAAKDSGDIRLTDTYFGEKAKNLTVYHAKHGRGEIAPKLDLELVPETPNSNRFVLLLRGTPVADSDVVLFTSSGWNRKFKTGVDGRVTIESPWSGPVVIEATHLEKKAGEHEGRSYEAIRHVFTLSCELTS